MSCYIHPRKAGRCVCECHGIKQIVPVSHCKVLSQSAAPKRGAKKATANKPRVVSKPKTPPVKVRRVESISNIGVRLSEIIKRDTGAAVPCGDCKSELLRLNQMTAEQVLAEIDTIADGIVARGKSLTPKWYQRWAITLAPGAVKRKVEGWIREACQPIHDYSLRSLSHPRAGEMDILTCFFNPAGFSRPVENFKRFRDKLGDLPLIAVELSYTGEFVFDDTIHLVGDPVRNRCWQKEALLNVALSHSTAKKVAWIDADILFDRPDWHSRAVRMLDQFPVGQLFDTAVALDQTGVNFDRKSRGVIAGGRDDLKRYWPGYAWAARREALPNGFYSAQIAGGADVDMFDAWNDRYREWYRKGWTEGRERHFSQWKDAALESVRGRIGHIEGTVYHLWHGSFSDRQYVHRRELLTRYQFNPETDVTIEPSGILAWTGANPKLESELSSYFHKRNEDG